MRRVIRFKETAPNIVKSHVPVDKYRKNCDDTLGEGPFDQRGTEDGFLATGNERPHATKNLVLLGDSFVESVFTEETKRFASIIERSLSDDWQVRNGGYSGATTLHLMTIMAAKIPTVMTEGSKLVLFIPQSDTTAMRQEGFYWSNMGSVTPVQPATLNQFAPWEVAETVERTIEALLSVVDAFGFDYGVVPAPYRDSDFDTDRVLQRLYKKDLAFYEEMTQHRMVIHDAARRAALRRVRPFLDAQSCVSPQDFYDMLHLNDSGHQKFSGTLSQWLDDWI